MQSKHCITNYTPVTLAISKSWNGKSGNGIRGMMGMRGTRVEMMGIRVGMIGMMVIRAGMWGIGVEMQGIGVGMRGIGFRNEENQGENLRVGGSGIDELELWRGIKIKGNMRIYKNIVLTLCYEKQLKKLI